MIRSLNPLLALTVVAAGMISPGSAADERDPVFTPPRKPNPANYSRLWTNSPFTEKVQVVQEQGPGFADKYRLEGVMSMDGKDVACLTNTETEDVLYLKQDEPVDGISLVSIQNRDQLDQMRVVLAAGGQRSTVSFDDAQMVVTPSDSAKKQATDNQQGQQKPATQQRETQQGAEKTKLSEDEMMERRRKFWEDMRNRRRRGGGGGDGPNR